MNKINVVAIAASLVGAPMADAQAGSSTNGIPGFLSSNGTFRPLRTELPTARAAATVFHGSCVQRTTHGPDPLRTPSGFVRH
jgi:hypothetical protein